MSEVQQDVYENGEFLYSAELLNKIRVEIGEVREASPQNVGAAREYVEYLQSEESTQGAGYRLSREYEAEYWLSERGYYTIGAQYFVPSVRNVPFFPEGNVEVGERWSEYGVEVFDFRESFGFAEPYSFSMPVDYEYIGPVFVDGRRIHQLKIDYELDYSEDFLHLRQVYPYRITGFSSQNLFFDNEKGRSHSYNERYEINLHLSDGRTLTFTGTAQAELIESTDFNAPDIAEDLRRALIEEGVEAPRVSAGEDGVTISLENIQFLPDSSELLPSEIEKLRVIARILREPRFADRDIFVAGHAALAGTQQGQQIVSDARAEAVAEYFIETGTRRRAEVLYRGYGAELPVASNALEEGRRRNRRVEITILEN